MILKVIFRTKMKAGEVWLEKRKRTSSDMRVKWRKLRIPTMVEENAKEMFGSRRRYGSSCGGGGRLGVGTGARGG